MAEALLSKRDGAWLGSDLHRLAPDCRKPPKWPARQTTRGGRGVAATEQATTWVRRRAAAKYLGYSLRGLDGLVQRGLLQGYRFGNRIMFDRAELEQAVRAGATRPRK